MAAVQDPICRFLKDSNFAANEASIHKTAVVTLQPFFLNFSQTWIEIMRNTGL